MSKRSSDHLKIGGWFSMKLHFDITFISLTGAAMALYSVYKSFLGGAIIGALLMLGRKGIELANKLIENKYGV